MQRTITIIGIILVLILSGIPTILSFDSYCIKQIENNNEIDWWPMFHHDIGHSGYSTSATPETYNIKWISSYGFAISSPAVANGKVYIGTHNGNVYCLNADTGMKIWEFKSEDSISIFPTVADGKLYIGSDDFKLYCLDSDTGEKIWDYKTGNWVRSSPNVAYGKVYFVSWDYKLYCLNASTGIKIWDYILDFGSDTSPAIFAGKIYVVSDLSTIYCFNADTGEKIWDNFLPNIGNEESNPTVINDKVYVGSSNHKVYCLDANTGLKLWTFLTNDFVYSSPAVAYGKVYIGSNNCKLYCLDADTGEKIWDYKTGGTISHNSPAVADCKVYISSWDNKLYCLNAETGVKIWDYNTSRRLLGSPIIANEKIYICGESNNLYCFESNGSNNPPSEPIIIGESNGKPGIEYEYSFISNDPENDEISYLIDWGDKTSTGWTRTLPSGDVYNSSHIWSKKRDYTIQAKAEDKYGAESNWSTFKVSMPKSKAIDIPTFLQRFFQRFPFIEKILNQYL